MPRLRGTGPRATEKHNVGAVSNCAYQGVLLAFASVLTIIAYPLSQDKGEHNTGQMDMTRDIPKKTGRKNEPFLNSDV